MSDYGIEEPGQRQVIARSWWLAAELTRRHPELLVYEMHPGGGMYDVLALLGPPYMENPTRIMLNRAGSIQVHVGNQMQAISTWREQLLSADPRDVLERIERAAGLPSVKKAAPSTQRVLAYRFVSQVLTITAGDRHAWDVRNEFDDNSGDWFDQVESLRGYLQRFPLAQADARMSPQVGLWSEPESHFWAILRDDIPVALVSIEGGLYVGSNQYDLMREYKRADRKVLPIVVHALGHVLP